MKLTIVRGGGIGGPRTRTELDSATLAPGDADAFAAKLRQAAALNQTTTGRAAHPDELSYELTIEDDRGQQTARFTDSTLPDQLRSLIAWADSRPERKMAIEPAG